MIEAEKPAKALPTDDLSGFDRLTANGSRSGVRSPRAVFLEQRRQPGSGAAGTHTYILQ